MNSGEIVDVDPKSSFGDFIVYSGTVDIVNILKIFQ